MDRVAVAYRILGLLDLTELSDAASENDIRELCRRARTSHGSVAAVCVWPRHVACARNELAGTAVQIATVANFPTGDESIPHVASTIEQALADGADEIDVVLPYRALEQGAIEHVAGILDIARSTAVDHTLKVILETGELGDDRRIADAAHLAIDHGADFIKTSTGKTATSATLDATRVMLDVIASTPWAVGLKPSGGIRTLDAAAAYLDQADSIMGPEWATPATFRIGASSLLDALLIELGDAP